MKKFIEVNKSSREDWKKNIYKRVLMMWPFVEIWKLDQHESFERKFIRRGTQGTGRMKKSRVLRLSEHASSI